MFAQLAAEALARAAERDVDVVAEPGGERDVPAAPEILRPARQVRVVEVDHQLEAEPSRRAARDVAVGREVRVDLDREGEDARPQDLEGRRLEREDLVGDQADVVGNHQLLEEAPRHQPQTRARGVGREVPRAFHLRQQRRGPFDRAGHQLREEGDVGRHVQQAGAGAQRAAIDVDGVAQRLEREKRDADRQHHLQHVRRRGQADARQDAADVVDEEVGVLEVRQHAQVRREAEGEIALPVRPVGAPSGAPPTSRWSSTS